MVVEKQEKLPKQENPKESSQISDLKKNVENTQKSFFKNAIDSLKSFVSGKERVEKPKEEIVVKQSVDRSSDSGEIEKDLLNLGESIAVSSTKEDLNTIKHLVVSKKKSLYIPRYESSKIFVETSDRGEVAPYIAQSADDLQNEINQSNSKILQYFYT